MIIDARRAPRHEALDCDVCVIGGGAAGITLALQLDKPKLSVCVLEAGGLEYETATQALLASERGYAGYAPLHTVRVAALGGSMHVWAGWCRPLDEIDFMQREAVPHSGWPFGLDELAPYYAQAHERLGLGPFDYDTTAWEKLGGAPRLPFSSDAVSTVLFRRSRANFGVTRRAALARSRDLRVLLHANVMRLRFTADGKAVTAVEAATLNGNRLEVRSRAVVVAAGGIESARLLLLSAGEGSQGPGNDHGLVGRFFTEHGYDESAVYLPADARRSLGFYYAKTMGEQPMRRTVRGALVPAAATLRREGLLNCATFFRAAYEADPVFEDPRVQAALELWDMLRGRSIPDRRFAKGLLAATGPFALAQAVWRKIRDRGDTNSKIRLRSLFECAPDPDNRVVLGADRDSLGRPMARVQWRFGVLDLRSVARVHELIDAGLRAAGLGRLQLQNPHAAPRTAAIGKHHLGTTRMHPDPARGVVDADSKVHGVDNLFVTGGSVFSTGGAANPTLTVVALALRLAAHLDRRLS